MARGVLIIVENLPVPFDRRVWAEARTLRDAGYEVSVICPKGKGATEAREILDGIHIYRHPLPFEATGAMGYLLEYSTALFWELWLAIRVYRERGFDVIQACNPPDLIFLIGAIFKLLFGTRFIFDHHDINPELYEAKFGHRNFLWKIVVFFERLSFWLADVSIATNQSYRAIAIERGGMAADRVFVVRSGPDLARIRLVPPDDAWKKGRAHMVAYIGVIGGQEGLDLLLEAAAHMRDTCGRRDVQFVIVGDGPEAANVRRLARDMQLDDIFTFTGRVDDATFFSVLCSAEVCVNPDRPNAMNDKSTMNKIMEYMAVGKPIVQFDLTEGRYSAQDASLYASDVKDFGDKIIALLDDPARRAAMGATGRARIEDQLAWPHEIPKLLAAYDTALGERLTGSVALGRATQTTPSQLS
ncbi:MAG: glycosyltransferase family 4 protein [Rhizomicrobium sp.]